MHGWAKNKKYRLVDGIILGMLLYPINSMAITATGINLGAKQAFDANHSVTIQLDQRPEPGEVRVFVGTTDLTALFKTKNDKLIFRQGVVELPRGESKITVYQVVASKWNEIGSFPIRVRQVTGLDRFEITPQLSLTTKSQLREGHSVDAGTPPRTTFNDITGQAGIGIDLARNDLSIQLQSNIIGSSFQDEALRFGELGPKAPRVDLSDYLLSIKKGPADINIGHYQFEGSRYIMPVAFNRGISTSYQANERIKLAATAQNSTEVVGYNNIFGVNQQDNRTLGAKMSAELLSRPGALKLEGFVSHGTQLANPGFNAGEITDAEQSQSGSIRLSTQTSGNKISDDVETAYSRFTNTADPNLEQGDTIQAVDKTSDSAFFAHLLYNAFDGQLASGKPLTTALAVEYERVDPLFKTVGVQSDLFQADLSRYQFSLNSTLGDATITVSTENRHDNLDKLSTVLTTENSVQKINASLPLKSMMSSATTDKPASNWLPTLNTAYIRTHQFGSNHPDLDPLSGFSPDQIPNQLTNTFEGSATWEGQRWNLALNHNRSTQDNRQTGRENADSSNTLNGLIAQLQVTEQLSVNAGISRNTANDQEQALNTYTLSHNLGANWVLFENWTLSSTVEASHTSDSQQNSDNKTLSANAQIAWQFTLPFTGSKKIPGQAFLRYDRQTNKTNDNLSAIVVDISNWAILAGVSITLF